MVEVLVALLIMAVIAAMGWQGVSGMVKARDIGASASERTLRLQTVIAQWEQDIGAVYDSPLVPGISFDGASLRLVRRNDGSVQVVVWALRDGRWQRWAGPLLQRAAALRESWLASQQLLGTEPGQLTVLDGVAGWQLYFWRGQGWSNAQSSGDQVTEQVAVPPPPASAASNTGGGTSSNSGSGGTTGGTTGTTTAGSTTGSTANTTTEGPITAAGAAATGASAPGVATRTRTLLPTGVRLQLDLPDGRIHRDVMLPPTS